MRSLTNHHSVRRDGVHLHITLPDVLPPDWLVLREDVEREIDAGVVRAFVYVPDAIWSIAELKTRSFARELSGEGIDVAVTPLPDPFEEVYLG